MHTTNHCFSCVATHTGWVSSNPSLKIRGHTIEALPPEAPVCGGSLCLKAVSFLSHPCRLLPPGTPRVLSEAFSPWLMLECPWSRVSWEPAWVPMWIPANSLWGFVSTPVTYSPASLSTPQGENMAGPLSISHPGQWGRGSSFEGGFAFE